MEEAEVKVMVADESHIKYIDTILTTIAEAAKKRGSGIAKRSPEYVATKMREAVRRGDGDGRRTHRGAAGCTGERRFRSDPP